MWASYHVVNNILASRGAKPLFGQWELTKAEQENWFFRCDESVIAAAIIAKRVRFNREA